MPTFAGLPGKLGPADEQKAAILTCRPSSDTPFLGYIIRPRHMRVNIRGTIFMRRVSFHKTVPFECSATSLVPHGTDG